MNEPQAIAALGALAQETRLRIVRYLVRCGDDGASAGDIGRVVEATSSRASFHLSALENAGLIRSERRSRNTIYRAEFEQLGGLLSFLLSDCCGANPDIRACCLREDCC
ncbi:MAG: metalloregulator ArsR/SmtB family transcription factor [Paracoccaceae bacterium]|nr:metalloregulator ArsR/SmtB family transcription factor [Paracoccaceae bacterium]MDE2914707.1 metalloregulator ArsR/SmtB family transcription factor [Paracoccaceae bacterium]